MKGVYPHPQGGVVLISQRHLHVSVMKVFQTADKIHAALIPAVSAMSPFDVPYSTDLLWTNFTTNRTKIVDENPLDKANRVLQIYILLGLASLGFLGNFLIIAVLCVKRLRERNFSNINFLILHLALSDLLVVSFCLFADAVWKITYTWLAGDFMCKFVKYMQMFSLYASTFIIVAISSDRCIAILCPISRFDHHRTVKVFASLAWIFAALCSIPQVRMTLATWSNWDDGIPCVSCGSFPRLFGEDNFIAMVWTFGASALNTFSVLDFIMPRYRYNYWWHDKTLTVAFQSLSVFYGFAQTRIYDRIMETVLKGENTWCASASRLCSRFCVSRNKVFPK